MLTRRQVLGVFITFPFSVSVAEENAGDNIIKVIVTSTGNLLVVVGEEMVRKGPAPIKIVGLVLILAGNYLEVTAKTEDGLKTINVSLTSSEFDLIQDKQDLDVSVITEKPKKRWWNWLLFGLWPYNNLLNFSAVGVMPDTVILGAATAQDFVVVMDTKVTLSRK